MVLYIGMQPWVQALSSINLFINFQQLSLIISHIVFCFLKNSFLMPNFRFLFQMCIQNNPTEARNMLLQNPQLAYALLQAQIVMKIVDPQVAMVNSLMLGLLSFFWSKENHR